MATEISINGFHPKKQQNPGPIVHNSSVPLHLTSVHKSCLKIGVGTRRMGMRVEVGGDAVSAGEANAPIASK